MSECRNPLHCVVPIYIVDALTKNPKTAEAAKRTMLAGTAMRERRRLLMAKAVSATTEGLYRTVYDAHGSETTRQLVWREGDADSADIAVREAIKGLGATYRLFRDKYGRDSIDGQGMHLDATVHFGDHFDNAFWDGEQMIFGDGDGDVFQRFTIAIDVIGHELTHGVTQFTANLEYHNQSGALNESFSDVFGSLVKQYDKGQAALEADWLIGAGLLAPGVNGKALRSMADPGSAYDDPNLGGKDPQPKSMKHYQPLPDTRLGDNGGVHINSGIPNHAFYQLATKLRGNAWDDAGHIWWATLQQLWPKAAFQDCAQVSYEVAGTIFGSNSTQQQKVREAWAAVDITVSTTGVGLRTQPSKPSLDWASNGARDQLRASLERIAEAARDAIQLL